MLFSYASIICFVWAVLIFTKCKLFRNKTLLPIILFLASGFVATVLNGNGLTTYLKLFLDIFSSVVLSYFYIYMSGLNAIKTISKILITFIIIGAITEITGGSHQFATNNLGIISNKTYYFLGTRVAYNRFIIFSLALSLIVFQYESKLFRYYSIIGGICSLFLIIRERVSTAIVTVLTFILVLTFSRIIRSKRIWRNISIFILGCSILFYFVSVNTELYEWFLTGFLDESITFNGRTYLWEQAIREMHGWHWLFGNGLDNGIYFMIGSRFSVSTAHSQYLNILFYFGIFGLLVYVLLLYNQFTVATKIENSQIRNLLIAANISIVVMGIPTTTFNNSVNMYIFYIIVCLLPKFNSVFNGETINSSVS